MPSLDNETEIIFLNGVLGGWHFNLTCMQLTPSLEVLRPLQCWHRTAQNRIDNFGGGEAVKDAVGLARCDQKLLIGLITSFQSWSVRCGLTDRLELALKSEGEMK